MRNSCTKLKLLQTLHEKVHAILCEIQYDPSKRGFPTDLSTSPRDGSSTVLNLLRPAGACENAIFYGGQHDRLVNFY